MGSRTRALDRGQVAAAKMCLRGDHVTVGRPQGSGKVQGRRDAVACRAAGLDSVTVDVASVLQEVCRRQRWSMAELAQRSGTSRSSLAGYARGTVSPTVGTLARILAAAGLQIRAELEPLLAELDVRVDAVLGDPPPLDTDAVTGLATLARVLGEQPIAWGLDGETALRAHGFGFVPLRPQVAIRFDGAAQTYFFRARVPGTGGDPVSWFDAELEQAQAYLGGMAFGPFGMVAVRLLPEEPATVRIEVAPGLVVPVLTVDEVARGRPDLAEVLDRLRERQGKPRGT